MTVRLFRSDQFAGEVGIPWIRVAGGGDAKTAHQGFDDIASRLEAAFDSIADEWLRFGKDAGQEASGRYAHTPTGGSYGSDFGLMLASSRIVEDLARSDQPANVFCNDPWMFRHLSTLPGVTPGPAPWLLPARLKLYVRGWLARIKLTFRVATDRARLSVIARSLPPGQATILVYGHPASSGQGHDAYFGGLLHEFPDLQRMLHVDCGAAWANELAEGGRTGSLHRFGCPWLALKLPFTRWRPSGEILVGPYGWIVRRAAAKENGGGGPAMIRWQIHCQDRWLEKARPRVVAWPWENHAWERALTRSARRLGIRTVGYQHAVVGRHQFNYRPGSNPDGLGSIPDIVVCNGRAYRNQLARFGLPEDRLLVGGAFRITQFEGVYFDPTGPVYVALSAISDVSRQMMKVVGDLAGQGVRFVIKGHPLYPFVFDETPEMQRIGTTIPETRGISAVIYCTGTPGLEGLLAGVPTFRLQLEDSVALDIMPDGVSAVAVTRASIAAALRGAQPVSPRLDWNDVMSPVDLSVWKGILGKLAIAQTAAVSKDRDEFRPQ